MPVPRLNIAVDARPLAFPHSGIGRYTACLLRELAQLNTQHRIHLYSDRPITLGFLLPDHWRIRAGSIEGRAISTLFAQIAFVIWAVTDSIDTFWSPRHHLPLLLPRAVRTVVTIHDVVWKRLPETMSRGGRWIEALLMPASLRRADRTISVSQFTAQEVVYFFPWASEKLEVIYEASSLPATPPEDAAHPNTGRPYFLFVGSNEPRKNLLRLIDAFSQYRKKTTEGMDLLLVGSYAWGDADIRGRLRELGIESSVRQIKAVDDNMLAELYSHARALVLPSLYEGFGLPLVEAMQYWTPVITSAASATEEIAGNAGLLVDPNDTEALSNALARVANDDELHARSVQAAKARSTAFDWRVAAQKTLSVLETVARQRPLT